MDVVGGVAGSVGSSAKRTGSGESSKLSLDGAMEVSESSKLKGSSGDDGRAEIERSINKKT